MFAFRGVRRRIVGLVVLLGLTGLLGVTLMRPHQVYGQSVDNPSLGVAGSFAVLAGSAVTDAGSSVVNGDLGVSPGSAITGSTTVNGTTHANDQTAIDAQTGATTAYNNLAGRTPFTDLSGQDLGGMTLTPGVYRFSSSAQLTGDLTLNAGGDANAIFVFQIGSALTTASSSHVILDAPGLACNVWWQVGSSATLGTSTSFAGNILADQSITLTTSASLSGRAIARNAAVTMDGNTISLPDCVAPNPGLSLAKDDGGVSVAPGGTVSYTLSYQNTGNTALNSVTLSDTVPAETTFNGLASTTGWNCVDSACTFDLGTLQPGDSGSKVFAVTVNDPTSATQISNGASVASGGTNANANDTTPVTAPLPSPGLSLTKSDGGVSVVAGGVIQYTLSYQNTGNVALNSVTLSDTVPAETTFNGLASTTGWNCVDSACTFDLGTLQPGDSGSKVFAVTVNDPTSATQISNGASVASGGTNANANDTTPVTPPSPGLSLTKSDGGVSVPPAGTISYTLSFQNTGNVPLAHVTLTDTVPAETTFNGPASTTGWNCVDSACTLDVGTLQPGDSGSAVFTVTVNASTSATQINNSASIASGTTTANGSDTTPVTTSPVATAVPSNNHNDHSQSTAVPSTPIPLLIFTATPIASRGAASGLPNTGGGPPQPTYWLP